MLEIIKSVFARASIGELREIAREVGTLKTIETLEGLEDDIERLEDVDARLADFEEYLNGWGKGGWVKGIVSISGGLLGFVTGYKLRNKKPKQAALNG